ncbi:uncharacterized protein LOC129588793 [Paramacrobiotus metropolitanus]|uniref:uncharacterized protein LOC129588793 n=1 Tax=Paramacrobiotus metropolitanus TaxID=2943436 RepID=UPI0024459EF5|nr:uncharacterized protein LOC129588793 [Paramacrobiotus metropolitanus]
MNWETILFSCFLVVFYVGSGSGFYYPITDLDDKCNRTIRIECPWAVLSSGRAGTFRYRRVPAGNCEVNITIRNTYSTCRYTPTLYFNIKKSRISEGAELLIHSTHTAHGWRLAKRIPGGRSPHNRDPTSVAQLKTRMPYMESQLGLAFMGDGRTSSSYELEIDYAVLVDDNEYKEVWCSALGAYINDDIACDEDDRITCPYDYYETIGLNPATGFGACKLSSGAIAGIVIGSVFGAAFLCGCCAACCSKSKPTTTSTANHSINSTVVVSGYTPEEPSNAAPPFPFRDDPPPYPADGFFPPLPDPSTLQATAAASTNTDPPKY